MKSDDVVWQVEPPTAKLALNATLTGAPSSMSIAMMRGECEHRQIVLAAANGAAELRNIRVHADADNVTPGLGARWSFKQVGYVNCTANADFRGTTDGWFPDILLPQFLAAGTAAGAGVLVELVPPKHNFTHVGGMERVKADLMRVAEAVKAGHTNRVPMGMIFEESEVARGKFEIVEVVPGSSAEAAGVRAGDLLRATTAMAVNWKASMEEADTGFIEADAFGGKPGLQRALFNADGQTFDSVLTALSSNAEDKDGPGVATLVIERRTAPDEKDASS